MSGQDELFPGFAQEAASQHTQEPEPVSPTDAASFRAPILQAHRRHSTDDILHFRTPTDARAPISLVPWQASLYTSRNPLDALRRKQARRQQHRKSNADSMTARIVEQPDVEERAERMGSLESEEDGTASSHGANRWDSSSTRQPFMQAPLKLAQRLLPARRAVTDQSDEPENDYVGTSKPETVVSPHPSLIPWDDTPDSSRPYDNPYYDDLPDYLWVPRDPFTVVDLDDTVELRRVILSSLCDDDDDEQFDVDTAIGLPAVAEIAAPEPVLVSPTSRAAIEGMEMRPLVQSPTRMSIASSPSQSDQDASPHNRSDATIRRPTSSSELLGLGSPPRRPSLAGVLSSRSTRRIPSGERVPGGMDGLTSPRSQNYLTATNVLGVWQQRHGDSASVVGASSALSRRSSGQSGRTQSRLRRPSWQTRDAIEARIREESEREDHTLRSYDRNEEAEDMNAERSATAGWTTLRRVMISSRPRD